MELSAPQIASAAAPGQFVHIHVRPVPSDRPRPSVPDQPTSSTQRSAQPSRRLSPEPSPQPLPQPLLRRPFSVSDADGSIGASITILYGVRGTGTQLLANVRPGDHLDVMGPLGRGFTLPEPPPQRRPQSQPQSQSRPAPEPEPEPELQPRRPSAAGSPHALLVGGGLGIAPLVFLANTLARNGHRVTVFYGANTAGEMQSALRRLQASGAGSIQVFTTTLDGIAGRAGIVTDLLTTEPSATAVGDVDYIYTCGPEPMMAAVERFAAAHRIPGEMSLETALACGVGACLGCARRLRANPGAGPVYARVCKDGPVFSFGQVELNPAPCGEE